MTEKPTERALSFNEIKEVFDSWSKRAMEFEKSAQLWNCLLDDLRLKAETPQVVSKSPTDPW